MGEIDTHSRMQPRSSQRWPQRGNEGATAFTKTLRHR